MTTTPQSVEFTFGNEKSDLKIRINEEKLEAANIDTFKEKLEGIWNGEIKSVTIDMDTVDFIDSSGIGALLSVQKRLKSSGEPLVLSNTNPNVVSIIELLRLHRVFTLQPKAPQTPSEN